jgi:ribosomal protein L37E
MSTNKINPAVCSDCSFPPNFAIVDLSKKEDVQHRFHVKCRDCGDEWTEYLDKDNEDED